MKQVIAFVILSYFVFGLSAQRKVDLIENDPTVAIYIAPFSFINNRAEFGVDIRVKERQWLTVAPILQSKSNDASYYQTANDRIDNGLGIKLAYRYFPFTRYSKYKYDGLGAFVSAGMTALSTEYDYWGHSYRPYEDSYGIDGYIYNMNTNYKERVGQLGLEVNIGYSLRLFDILFAEAYIGVGSRYSDYEYDGIRGFRLDENPYDTGYSGFTPTGGLRIGLFLNRYSKW